MTSHTNASSRFQLHTVAERIVDQITRLNCFAEMRERDDWRATSAGIIEQLGNELAAMTLDDVMLMLRVREERANRQLSDLAQAAWNHFKWYSVGGVETSVTLTKLLREIGSTEPEAEGTVPCAGLGAGNGRKP